MVLSRWGGIHAGGMSGHVLDFTRYTDLCFTLWFFTANQYSFICHENKNGWCSYKNFWGGFPYDPSSHHKFIKNLFISLLLVFFTLYFVCR